MAHIVASITVFVNAPPLYLPRRYAIANAGLPRCLVPLPREWRPTGHVFLASSCLTPNKGICSYLLGIRSITDRTNQAAVFSNQICS